MKNLGIGFLLVLVLVLSVRMVALAGSLVPPPLPPATATNAFASGSTSIHDQAVASLPNGLPLAAVVQATFNCGSFQVLCESVISNTIPFDSCIDQVGTVLSNATTIPSSTPDDICAAFVPSQTMSGVGILFGYYSQ